MMFYSSTQARQLYEYSEARPAEEIDDKLNFVGCISSSLIITIPDEKQSEQFEFVLDFFNSEVLKNNENPTSSSFLSTVFHRKATHILLQAIMEEENKVLVLAKAYFYYLDLENLGPIIEGDLVIQGVVLDDSIGPALCTVSAITANSTDYQELQAIYPSRMILTPGEDESDLTKFLVPIHLDNERITHGLQILIYIHDRSALNYEDDSEEENVFAPQNRDMLILACSFSPSVTAASIGAISGEEQLIQDINGTSTVNNDNNPYFEESDAERLILRNVKIATDFDDVISLQQEGYHLICSQLDSNGRIMIDQDHMWKFHVLGEYGDAKEPGVEDIQWIKCLKSLGTLPSLPFYHIMHDYDLSRAEDDYSVYLGVKIGLNAKYKKLIMLAADDEVILENYVASISGNFRIAPDSVDKNLAGYCGLLLLDDEAMLKADVNASPHHIGATMGSMGSPASSYRRNGDIDGVHSDEEDGEDDFYQNEEEIFRSLQLQHEELENEKRLLLSHNADLQKRAVILYNREKMLQGSSTAAAGSSMGMRNTTNTDPNHVDSAGGGNEGPDSLPPNLEKEKQYQDTLQLIIEERKKLNKQLKEFDQLALDLQTRLDDKEYKANSIASSFKQFKKEILGKAENTRTGHAIPKQVIQQIEVSESKHEEDLEKIRLRHISLKTLQKKLEKTLRAREQLAEGLHMIDFEQLKIENQTLNEKIEEKNEELTKLKRKKTTTVQILTHIREKLIFVEQSNRALQTQLINLDNAITQLRNSVTIQKLARDELKVENKEYKAKQGFATSDLLLLDYEKRKSGSEELKMTIQELKNRYEILLKQVQSTASFTQPNSLSSSTLRAPLPLANSGNGNATMGLKNSKRL